MTTAVPSVLASVRRALLSEAANASRYRYFRTTAEIEGNAVAAELFAELAESSECAAAGHVDVLLDYGDPVTGQPIGVTDLNLASALTGELHEMNEVYPELAAAALDEGIHDLASWLSTMRALKESHVERLRGALSSSVDGPPATAATAATGSEEAASVER